jgi:hypothetical protein
MRSSYRLIFLIPLLAVLLAALAGALRLGVAGSYVYHASREMSTWLASGAHPGVQTWEWVRADLEQAQAITRRMPDSEELLGVLNLVRGAQGEAGFDAEALTHFEKALAARPTSPYSWANVVATLYRMGDTSKRFESALRNAAFLGPWEPEVQRAVADYGLAAWNDIGPAAQKSVRSIVSNGIRRNPKEMLQIAERRGRLAVACRLLPTEPRTLDVKWSQLCQGTESTS